MKKTVDAKLTYDFMGNHAARAGYAEGKLTFSASKTGYYGLYWSDDIAALKGYYEIARVEITLEERTKTVAFGYHAAIPAKATKVIAIIENEKDLSVDQAVAVYDLPKEKQLCQKSKDMLYSFCAYSDIHIDEEHWGETPAAWYEYSENHWENALAYASKKNADFILSVGDQVTNGKYDNLKREWQAYHYIFAQSDYLNPIYETCGNHEIREKDALKEQIRLFIQNTGLDSDMETIQKNKPYYTFIEPYTKDLFIVMALEKGYHPADYDEFTEEQLDWVEHLLENNYGNGRNIYLVQHALMKGYGPGDDLETPYYGGAINASYKTAVRFKRLLEKYKEIIWLSGHSHMDFSLGYNYTNDEERACNMLHISSVSNPTHVTEGAIDYSFNENLSQGYYVQVFEKAIIFNGVNLCGGMIYPMYSYIVDGDTTKKEQKENDFRTNLKVTGGNVRSAIANAGIVLGIYYEYSSYKQYQKLKKSCFYAERKDVENMTDEERSVVYDEISSGITELHNIVSAVSKTEM